MHPPVKFDHLPHFKPKKQKLLAALLVMLEEAGKRGKSLTRGELVKILFLADCSHLDKHQRPITFDNYVAMAKGPVGDLAIDMLRGEVDWSAFALESDPWTVTLRHGLHHYWHAGVAANRKKLSVSDMDELVDALDRVTEAGFDRTSEDTHDHPAWALAWDHRDNEARAAAMDWRLFPAVPHDVVSDLVMSSWNAA